MRKKLEMDVDRLAVETFETGTAEDERGTVHGHGDGCTCAASCDCKTAIMHCAEIAWTVYSCDYTDNESCYYYSRLPCTG